MCIVSTVSSLRVVGNVSVCGVNKVDLRKKTKTKKKKKKKSKQNNLRETDRNLPLCDSYPEITPNVKVQQMGCSA